MQKKLSYLLVLFVFMFGFMLSVNATSMKLEPETIEVGKSTTLTLSNPSRNSDYKINYDKTLLDANNNCGNSDIVFLSKVTDGCTIVFTAKKTLSLTENKIVELKLTDEGGSEPEIKKLTIKANKITTTSTTQATTTSSVSPSSTTKTKSNNAKLKGITITSEDKVNIDYTPKFSSTINEYSATVKGEIDRIIVNAQLEDTNASLVISDNVKSELVPGENNKITINVIAEDGQTKNTYTINVLREALETDATLKSLKIKESPSFKLTDGKFVYNVEVEASVKKLTIDYTTVSDKSSVLISGNDDLKDGSIVKITVTSEDGSKKEYKLTVVKVKKTSTTEKVVTVSSNKNPLIIIGLSLVAFSLIGGIIYVAKK